jgi:hypothetical protein
VVGAWSVNPRHAVVPSGAGWHYNASSGHLSTRPQGGLAGSPKAGVAGSNPAGGTSSAPISALLGQLTGKSGTVELRSGRHSGRADDETTCIPTRVTGVPGVTAAGACEFRPNRRSGATMGSCGQGQRRDNQGSRNRDRQRSPVRPRPRGRRRDHEAVGRRPARAAVRPSAGVPVL